MGKKELQHYPLDDSNAIKDFEKIIREIIRQEIKKLYFDRTLPAQVVSTPTGGTCSIQLFNEGDVITSVKIRTGLTLVYGDNVYVKFINNSSNNFFIDEKK